MIFINAAFLQAFLASGSISKHLHCTKSYLLLPDPGPARLGGPTQKCNAFTQPLSHKEFGLLIPKPKVT